MLRKRIVFLLPAAFISMAAASPARSVQSSDNEALLKKIDAVMSETYKPGEPGAAIIVRKDGRTIFRKGYGLADLELACPLNPTWSSGWAPSPSNSQPSPSSSWPSRANLASRMRSRSSCPIIQPRARP